jgi:hypothetical protein
VCQLASPAPNVEDALAVDRLNEIHQGMIVLPDKTVLALVSIDVPLDHNSDKRIRKRGEKENKKWMDRKDNQGSGAPA